MTITTVRKTAAIVLLAVGALGMSACSPTNNNITSAAKAAFEDRLAEQQVVDAKIKAGILDRLIGIDKMLAIDLSVDVWKTRVMLTGTLSSAAVRNKVARAVQEDGRVSQFYNEVQIITEDEKATRREWKETAQSGADKAAEFFDDFWIETKLTGQLLAADGVNSVNYRWRSVLGTVYLLGEAQSSKELNAVVTIIKNTKGVRALKTHTPVQG